MTATSLAALSMFTLAALAGTAQAQFGAVSLHPASVPGATESGGLGIGMTPGGLRQVGGVTISGASHAAMWSGGAATFVDLNPMAGAGSIAYDVSGDLQVGTVFASGVYFAASWSGSAASYVNISGGVVSNAYAVDDGIVGGSFVSSPTSTLSCQWVNGVRTTLSGGGITGVDDGARVTSIRTGNFPLYSSNALLFPAGGGSINLHPAGTSGSSATDVSGNQQVGSVRVTQLGQSRAALWTGSAASWLDLHPRALTTRARIARA